MWIIPENLDISHFVPDTRESISDLNELSEILTRSLMWKSKPSQRKTWLRRLKTTCSTWRLFGRILKPSIGQDFETALTSSAGGFLVNHLVLPEKKTPTPMRGIYGRTLLKGSPIWDDLPLFFWRTSKASLAADSKAISGATPNQRPFCFMSLENWKGWTTIQRREYLARLKSAHRTNENESSSWLAVPILANQGATLFPKCSESRNLWITPAAQAGANREKLYTKTGAPWQGDGRAYRLNGMHRTLSLNMQVSIQPREDQNSDHLNPQESRPKLNPRWVEMLMGLPVGWAMPSCVDPWIIELVNCDCLETELCPQPPSERLESFGQNWVSPISSDGEGGVMRYIDGSSCKYKLRDQVTWSNNGLP